MGMRRVLVIDEDQNSIGLFGRALEPAGIDVFVIDTPDKGIEKAIEVEPDLIFVNLIFQDSNGLKVSKLIHAVEKLRKVPIVMLISNRRDLDPKYTSTIGVVDVLVKPLEEEAIREKTGALLGEVLVASEPVAEMPGGDEPYASASFSPESAKADPDRAGGPAEAAEFVRQGGRLIDQAVTRPEGGGRNIFGLDEDIPGDDVIHLRRPETPEPGGEDSSDYKSDEEIEMEERNLFEEADEKKEAVIEKSFADDFEDVGKEEPVKHDYDADDYVFEEDILAEEKAARNKKVLMAVGGVLVVVVLGIGAYQAKKTFFKDGMVKAPAPVQKEVVKENLPPAAAPEATVAVPPPAAKGLPPADLAAKTEPEPAAVPAPAVASAPAQPAQPVRKEQEKPRAAAMKEAPAKEAPAKAAKAKAAAIFAVQAGYFGSEKNAEALAAKLKGKGYEAYVQKGEAAGKGGAKSFYRVLIGKFDSAGKAAAQAREMKKKENLAVVVHRG